MAYTKVFKIWFKPPHEDNINLLFFSLSKNFKLQSLNYKEKLKLPVFSTR